MMSFLFDFEEEELPTTIVGEKTPVFQVTLAAEAGTSTLKAQAPTTPILTSPPRI